MKKWLYYLPNIILGLYLIIYIPMLKYFFSIVNQDGFLSPYKANDKMDTISWIVIIFAVILKIIFKRSKLDINRKEKMISLVLFIIETLLIFFLGLMTAVA